MSQYARYPVESVFVTNFPTEIIVNQGTSPWVVSGTVAATQSGAWSVGRTWALASGTDSVASVQSGSWTVSISGTVAVTQSTSPWVVSGTVAATQSGTWNINNISGTVSLPTGAATSANQATQITQLTSIFDRQADGTQRSQIATPPALTIKQAAITVGTSAVRLTTDGNAPSASRVILVGEPDPNATANFYIGSSSVTSSGATRGTPLEPGGRFIANNDAGDYYIISDTAAQTVFVVEQE